MLQSGRQRKWKAFEPKHKCHNQVSSGEHQSICAQLHTPYPHLSPTGRTTVEATGALRPLGKYQSISRFPRCTDNPDTSHKGERKTTTISTTELLGKKKKKELTQFNTPLKEESCGETLFERKKIKEPWGHLYWFQAEPCRLIMGEK